MNRETLPIGFGVGHVAGSGIEGVIDGGTDSIAGRAESAIIANSDPEHVRRTKSAARATKYRPVAGVPRAGDIA